MCYNFHTVSRRLSDEFHVSIATITAVLNALRDEGLIEIQPRRAPLVIQREHTGEDGMGLAVLRKRDNILQSYDTFRFVIPCCWPLPPSIAASKSCPVIKRW